MVAHFTMRTHGVKQAFRFVEGIWLHGKSRQIRFIYSSEETFLLHTCAICSELPFYISTMYCTSSVLAKIALGKGFDFKPCLKIIYRFFFNVPFKHFINRIHYFIKTETFECKF